MSWCVNRWHGATIGRHSLSQPCGLPAPSEREPGTAAPFIVPLRNHKIAGDFHRPYETRKPFPFTIQRAAQKPQDCGRFSSPLRNSETVSLSHSSCRPETARLRAIFIAPTKLGNRFLLPFNRVLAKTEGCGRFSSPLRKLRNRFLFPCNQPNA